MAYSPEFMEEMLKQTKKYVPQWLYQNLVSYAKPIAGGRARHRAGMSISDDEMERMSDDELESMSSRFSKACDYRRRKREQSQVSKAVWTTAYINTLPDSAFLHIESGGDKDEEGKTVPRTLRHLPFKDSTGKIDLPHLRNALARIPQTSLPSDVQERLTSRARKILENIQKSKVVFVGYELSPLEKARQEMFVGETGRIFDDVYLKALDIEKQDVSCVVLKDFDLKDYEESVIVALGRQVSKLLGNNVDFVLPHPEAVRKHGDSGEVARKSKAIKQYLVDRINNAYYDRDNEPIYGLDSDSADFISVQITKAYTDKRIVYGVVMDPYGQHGAQEDAHNDWTPPAEIEKSAHNYLSSSRQIRLQHAGPAQGRVVESWVEQYPTRDDYLKAMNGQAHSVIKRRFGDDFVHSGSWIMGVELGDKEWGLYQKGQITGFSPGGFGSRQLMDRREMPKVSFIDLVEKKHE